MHKPSFPNSAQQFQSEGRIIPPRSSLALCFGTHGNMGTFLPGNEAEASHLKSGANREQNTKGHGTQESP